jgi:serine/threonine protein kinase
VTRDEGGAPSVPRDLTFEEAIGRIEAARHPGDLFGGNASRGYRRLARLTHPDAHPGDARAARAFAKLAALWRQHQGGLSPAVLVARGDLANLYETGRGLVKLPRDPADNDLMEREAAALTQLQAQGDQRYRAYAPRLLEIQCHQDPRSGARRHANVLERLHGFHSLAEVHRAFPDGVDPKDAAWMWRRLLVALGFAHRAGVVHGAVLPEHVMIHPADHGLTLIDWCYSVGDHGDRIPAMVERYRAWYPPEVLERRVPGPHTDLYLATRCMTQLMGDAARPLITFARGCALPNPERRPRDAWLLLGELDELLERLYGPRRFRPFAMPA